MTDDEWQDLLVAAYDVHQAIWFFGENNEFPPGLSELPRLDEKLAAAIAAIPYQPGGNMGLRVNTERKGVSLVWDEVSDEQVTVFAEGEHEDMHNKLPQPNNGEAGVFFPSNFTGGFHAEVRREDGSVVVEADLSV